MRPIRTIPIIVTLLFLSFFCLLACNRFPNNNQKKDTINNNPIDSTFIKKHHHCEKKFLNKYYDYQILKIIHSGNDIEKKDWDDSCIKIWETMFNELKDDWDNWQIWEAKDMDSSVFVVNYIGTGVYHLTEICLLKEIKGSLQLTSQLVLPGINNYIEIKKWKFPDSTFVLLGDNKVFLLKETKDKFRVIASGELAECDGYTLYININHVDTSCIYQYKISEQEYAIGIKGYGFINNTNEYSNEMEGLILFTKIDDNLVHIFETVTKYIHIEKNVGVGKNGEDTIIYDRQGVEMYNVIISKNKTKGFFDIKTTNEGDTLTYKWNGKKYEYIKDIK